MYKSDKHRVEDALIPFILDSLFLSQMKQASKNQESFDKARKLVIEDINTNVSCHPKLQKRLDRVGAKVLRYFTDWPCRKAYMVITQLACALHNEEAVNLGEGTKEVVSDIDKTIVDGYTEIQGLDKQDASAAKHVPKVLKIIQDEGYF